MNKEEVFIITIDNGEGFVELHECASIMDMNLLLETITYGDMDNYDNIEMYHGIILPCDLIPDTFNGQTPYLIIKNPENEINQNTMNEACFIKMPSNTKTVRKKIEQLIWENNAFIVLTEIEIKLKINHISLFFGYKLSPIMQAPEEYIDEEVIKRLKKLQTKIQQYTHLQTMLV